MAKLKTRTNQPVVDGEGLLDHLSQEGNTTQVGGDLEVDGEMINDVFTRPNLITLLALTGVPAYEAENLTGNIYDRNDFDENNWYRTPYTEEQIIQILNKYHAFGFTSEYGDRLYTLFKLIPLDKITYEECFADVGTIYTVSNTSDIQWEGYIFYRSNAIGGVDKVYAYYYNGYISGNQ